MTAGAGSAKVVLLANAKREKEQREQSRRAKSKGLTSHQSIATALTRKTTDSNPISGSFVPPKIKKSKSRKQTSIADKFLFDMMIRKYFCLWIENYIKNIKNR